VAATNLGLTPLNLVVWAKTNAGRVCRGLEIDPLYVDVIIRRYEAAAGKAAPITRRARVKSTLSIAFIDVRFR
jgi:DNA modification methylase